MTNFIEKVTTDEEQGTVFLPFNESQREKVLDEEIQLTARTGSAAEKLGMSKGDERYTLIRLEGEDEVEREAAFRVKCLGVSSIDTVGLDRFKNTALGGEKPQYRPTMLFMLGYQKATLYTVERIEGDEVPPCLLEETEDESEEDEPYTDPEELFTDEDMQALQDELPF